MNWGIFGHEWAVHLLKQHILQGNLRHAYLITGPQGVGRRTLALRLAQAINCPQRTPDVEPCGTCSTCTRLMQMIYPDLSVVQAEQEGGTLKVDQVRELQHILSLTPYEGRYRVALLLRFEEAHPSASNALLKTLEEPNPQVILILTANSTDYLLPTVVSRCEVLRLGSLPLEVVSAKLQEEWNIPADQSRLLAHLSNGRPGMAFNLHQHPERMAQRSARLDEHKKLLSTNRIGRFSYADTLYKDKEKTRLVLLIWLSFWRDILLKCTGATNPLTNLDREDEINNLAAKLDLSIAHRVTSALVKALDHLDLNMNTRLTLEVLLLDIPFLE